MQREGSHASAVVAPTHRHTLLTCLYAASVVVAKWWSICCSIAALAHSRACHKEAACYELVASVLGVLTRSNNITAADKEVVCLICLALLWRAAHVEHAG